MTNLLQRRWTAPQAQHQKRKMHLRRERRQFLPRHSRLQIGVMLTSGIEDQAMLPVLETICLLYPR
jgi:hypothetical protein